MLGPVDVDDQPRRVTVPRVLDGAAAWSWRMLLVVAATAVAVLILIQLYVVVVPVVLALFLASVLEPLAARLRRHGWPASLAAITVFVGALGVVLAALVWIGASVASQFGDLGEQIDKAVDDAKDWAQGEPLNWSQEKVDELESEVRETVRSASGGVAEQAAGQARLAGEVLGGIVLLLFTLFFVMKDGARMADWLLERVPPRNRDDVVAITRHSRFIMKQYLVATAATGFIDAVLIGLALWVLGVPLILPLAVLTFLGGFIPLVGASVAGLLAAVVALVTNGLGTALLVVAATVAVQQIEGNLLQPLILERAVRLHALVTVWAVSAGLLVGGLLGAFISVPLVAIAVGIGSHYRSASAAPAAGSAAAAVAPASVGELGAAPPVPDPPADPDPEPPASTF
ncbi:MAG: hypothetical protein QOH36_1979 [Actinomycetota bacterium]|nr:hypothetical protein [Actinomycetota bacterium]